MASATSKPLCFVDASGGGLAALAAPAAAPSAPSAPGAPSVIDRATLPRCPGGAVYIPGGRFSMGSPAGEGAPDEHPQHTVLLRGYCLDRTEVTVDAYTRCVRAGACTRPVATLVALMEFAPCTTWWLVSTTPSDDRMMPVPLPTRPWKSLRVSICTSPGSTWAATTFASTWVVGLACTVAGAASGADTASSAATNW